MSGIPLWYFVSYLQHITRDESIKGADVQFRAYQWLAEIREEHQGEA